MPRPAVKGVVLAALVLLTGLGFAVRWRGAHRGCWIDELTTAWVVRDGFADIPARAWLNNLSPPYYYVTAAAARAFGYHEWSLRLPSLVAGTLLIPSLFWLCLRFTGSWWAGLAAAFFAAFDPNLVAFSLELRPYALVLLAAVWQVYCFARLFDGRPWAGPACGLLGGLLFHLHYLAALLFFTGEAAFVLVLVLRAGRPSRRQAAPFAVAVLVAVAVALPAVPHFLYLLRRKDDLGFAAGRTLWQALTRFGSLEYVVLPALAVLALAAALRRRPDAPPPGDATGRWRLWVLFLACWFWVPVLLAWALTRTGLARIDQGRYVLASLPALPLAVGLAVGLGRRWAGWAYFLCALVLLHVVVKAPLYEYAAGTFPDYRGDEWGPAVALVNDRADADPVLVESVLVESRWLHSSDDPLLRAYLLAPVTTLYPIDAARHDLRPLGWPTERFDAADVAALRRAGGGWVLSRTGGGVTITPAEWQAQVARELRAKGLSCDVRLEAEFRAVLVARLTVTDGEATAPAP
jgi:4-amino-4-deoxy-L-arabinose transferase-like glycosyltransferase